MLSEVFTFEKLKSRVHIIEEINKEILQELKADLGKE